MRASAARAALVVALVAPAARAQEAPVWIDLPPEDPFGRRVAEELSALGHPVARSREAVPSRVSVRVTPQGARATARVQVGGGEAVSLELDVSSESARAVAALRVVEAVRAGLIARPAPAAPAPRASSVAPRSAWEDVHGALGGAILASPGGVDAMPAVFARLSWERTPWVELVAHVAVGGASTQGTSLRVSSVALGVGAALVHGSRGALGVTLRGGLAIAEARGAEAASGVVATASGALLGRVRVWRRVGLLGELAVGTALAPVRLRAGGQLVGEWGRPFLQASIGVSF